MQGKQMALRAGRCGDARLRREAPIRICSVKLCVHSVKLCVELACLLACLLAYLVEPGRIVGEDGVTRAATCAILSRKARRAG